MPGRPKVRAQRESACKAATAQLAADVFALAPDRYLADPLLADRDANAGRWKHAVEATLDAAIRLEELGDGLRIKAGIGGPSPLAELVQSADGADFAAHVQYRIQARLAPIAHVDTSGGYNPSDFVGTW